MSKLFRATKHQNFARLPMPVKENLRRYRVKLYYATSLKYGVRLMAGRHFDICILNLAKRIWID